MISLSEKKDCCGCWSCVQRCPKQCITMREDEEGFLYPKVDESVCIDCGLCEKVCPVINQDVERKPLEVFAAKNPNEEIRKESPSGGIFTMLAEKVIDEGGIVFGACFNNRWEVVHQSAETKKDLAKFRGSKYVQSKVLNTYKEAETQLKLGRKVLYSGTPCQIAGLKRFLRKDYDNLLTIDFICHGVPSPGVFRTYLQNEFNKVAARQGGGKNTVLLPCIPLVTESDGIDCKGLKINSITFRDKRNGWKKFGFALVLSEATAEGENSVLLSYSPLNKNLFLRGFLRDLYLRPSCYACPTKHLKSGSDITLGDWWGIASLKPDIDDDRGVSAVTVNTEKGQAALHNLKAELHEMPYDALIKYNPALVRSAAVPKNREEFFKQDGRTFEGKITALARIPFSLKRFIKEVLRKVLPTSFIKWLKHILGIR